MRKNFLISILIIATIFVGRAQATEVDNAIRSSVVITKHDATLRNSLSSERKEVYLIDPKLTPQQKRMILNYQLTHVSKTNYPNNISLPNKVYVGMNGVPVLDQGKYGTCVTFANTAAIDALIGKGDYISQLCNLKLGEYLSSKGVFLLSGWWGAPEGIVLNQLLSFGFINKTNQKAKSCGGVTEYPLDDKNVPGKAMSLDEFQSMREGLIFPPMSIGWDSLLTESQRFTLNPANSFPPYDGDKILMQAKQFLASVAAKTKDNPIGMITFGVLVPVQYCSVGACGSYHETDDTWVITKAIANIDPNDYLFKLAAHEMIIMGYDDDAIAIDNEGVKHQGLLILRNSFGDNVGDHGDYYMTYDFFKKFAVSVQAIYQPDYCLIFDCKDKFKS